LQALQQLKALQMQNEMMEQQLQENERLRQAKQQRIAEEHWRIAEEEEARYQQRIKAEYLARMDKAAETDPHIWDIARDPTLPINPAMAQIVMRSEYAPEIIPILEITETRLCESTVWMRARKSS